MAAYPEGARVAQHELTVNEEDPEVAEVGRVATGTFVSIPHEGVRVIQWLTEGMTIGDVRQQFMREFGTELDLDDLLENLSGLGFIKAVGSQTVTADTPAAPPGWQFFTKLPSRRVHWIVSKYSKPFYWASWTVLPVLLASRPELIPEPTDAVGFGSPLLDFVALTAIGWLLLSCHEAAHVLTARGLDCPTHLNLGHRLHFLVAQTEMTSVRARPRKERSAPYLAGLTWDIMLLLACSSLCIAGVVAPLLRSVAFLTLTAIIFQFAVFMRTDMYFALSNWLRVDNLMEDTRKWMSITARRAIAGQPSRHDLSNVPPRERRLLPWYALLCIVGVAVAVLDLLFLGLPVLMSLCGSAFRLLASSSLTTSEQPSSPPRGTSSKGGSVDDE